MVSLLVLWVTVACWASGCSCAENRRSYLISDSLWDESNRRINESVEPADSTVFFVTKYDPDRDPFEDLEAAVSLAEAENKHIILVIGGNWCLPCLQLDHFWVETESISERLVRNFVVMKVNVGSLNHNDRFLSQFPDVIGYPHIFVLDSNGKTILPPVKGTGFGLFDEELFATYLDWWAPESKERTM